MLRMRFLPLIIAFTVGLVTNTTYAQPQIYGDLSGTLGPGDYIVIGDINVLSGTTLTIEPGTTFLHSGHNTWFISGTLTAEGTEAEPIIFKRQYENEAYKWGGIRISGSNANETILDYCVIDYCKNINFPNNYGGGMYINISSPTVRNTKITNCYATFGGGVYITYYSAPVFDGCTVLNNTAGNGGGFYLYSYSHDTVIKNCIVAKNSSTST